MKTLYSSNEIRKAVKKILASPKERRVIISAFIGDGAEDYIPKPKGIHLVCWPNGGGTNPDALRNLIDLGVDVLFADKVHMKVYWAKNRGCVITSANLSRNGFGPNEQKEIGVLLDSKEVNIDKILSSLGTRTPTPGDWDRLDRDYKRHKRINGIKESPCEQKSFEEWYQTPHRPKWKLCYWGETDNKTYPAVSKKLKNKFDIDDGYGYLRMTLDKEDGKKYKEDDWVLYFKSRDKTPAYICWMYVDYNIRIQDRKTHYVIGQARRPRKYLNPPFECDAEFTKAFKETLKRYWDDAGGMVKPQKRLIDKIYKEYHQ